MKKGVHYDKTFAATPNQHSSRMMQAMRVRHKWKSKCFDIKQAYCWAELEPGQLIALKYPKGFERYGTMNMVNPCTWYAVKTCMAILQPHVIGLKPVMNSY